VALLTPEVGPGTDGRYPSIETTFDPASAPGLNGLPEFLRTDAIVGFDWRDSSTHPRSGGHYQVTASQYDGRHDTLNDFRRVDVQLQQIVPLGNRYRRIELRGQAALTDADDDGARPDHLSARAWRPVDAARFQQRALPGSPGRCRCLPNTNGKRGGRSMPPCSSMRAR
jgi:hypothetical protein